MTNAIPFALDMIERGCSVFALADNLKTPPEGQSWLRSRTTNPKVVQSRLQNTSAYGVATGQGLLVVDVDVKNGKQGDETFDELDTLYGFPKTFTVRTGSGGRHLYYRVKPEVLVSNDNKGKLGQDIDLKGENGYVVGPGSVAENNPYTILNDAPIADCPEWIIEAANKVLSRDKEYATPLVEWDLPANVERARRFLSNEADPAVQYHNGNDTTYHVACQLRDYAISKSLALDMMLEHYNGRCEPPWDAFEMERIVADAYLYAKRRPGTKVAGTIEFADLPAEFLEKAEKVPVRALSLREAKDLALTCEIDFLVKDILNRNSMAIIYGPSGSGKSFLVLDIGFHVAAGIPWNGHETKMGAVLYLATEGGIGVLKRCAALHKHYDVQEDIPLYVLTYPVDFLRSAKDIKAVICEAKRIEETTGQPLQMVVIDTVARAMAGGDENTSTDMGQYVKNMDKLQEKLGCTVLHVHHTGKDVARGARGWSGLRAATDTEIEILDGSVRITKQRDIEFIEDIRFRLKKVPLKDGLGSCVIDFLEPNEFVKVELKPSEKRIWRAFYEMARAQARANGDPENWQSEVVCGSDIRPQIIRKGVMSKTTFSEGIPVLTGQSVLKKIKHNHWVVCQSPDDPDNPI